MELLPAACKYCGHNFQHHSIRQPRKSAEPHPAPKSSRLSSDTNPSQLSDEDFALLVKQRVGGDGDKAALVDQIFPKKPKTPAEQRKDALDSRESKLVKHSHECKVLLDMENRYKRMCEDLVEYKDRLESQREKTTAAQRDYEEAQSALQAIDASAAPPSSPFPTASCTYPTKVTKATSQLSELLASVLPPDRVNVISEQVSSILRDLQVPPPPRHSFTIGDDEDWQNFDSFDDPNSGNTADLIASEEQLMLQKEAMDWKHDAKRGSADVASGDESMDSDGLPKTRSVRRKPDAGVPQATIHMAERLAEAGAQSSEVHPPLQGDAQSAGVKEGGDGDEGTVSANPSSSSNSTATPTDPSRRVSKQDKGGRGGKPKRGGGKRG